MNKVQLVGRLTRDPELRTTGNGVSVCSFTVAVNRRFRNAQGEYEADFINCVAWRQNAEFLSRYAHKGDMVAVVGMLTVRKYEDKDGNKRVAYEVLCDRVESLQKRDENQQGNYSQYAAKAAQYNAVSAMDFDDIDDEDTPF